MILMRETTPIAILRLTVAAGASTPSTRNSTRVSPSSGLTWMSDAPCCTTSPGLDNTIEPGSPTSRTPPPPPEGVARDRSRTTLARPKTPHMRVRSRESAMDAVAEAQRALREGDGDAHVACAERALGRFPEDAGVRLEYASALLARDPDLAASEALRAVGLDAVPDAARLTRAAGLLFSLGETAAARWCVEQAATAGPTNVVIVNQLAALRGQIAAREQDYSSAEHFLRVAHEADPSNPFFACDLARVILVSKDHDARLQDALDVIDRTLTLAPDHSYATLEGRKILEQLRAQIRSVLDEPSRDQPSPGTPPRHVDPRLDPRPGDPRASSERGLAAAAASVQPRAAADAVVQAQKLQANGKAKRYLSFTQRAVSKFPNDAAIRLEHATALAPNSPANAIGRPGK